MDALFTSSENSKITFSERLVLNLAVKTDLKRVDKYVALSNLSMYYKWKNIKKSFENNKLKTPQPTWDEEFEFSDGSYSPSDIQYYFRYIIKQHEIPTDKSPIQSYIRRIGNRITLKMNSGYYLELSIPKTMKLHGITEIGITKDKSSKDVSRLKIIE